MVGVVIITWVGVAAVEVGAGGEGVRRARWSTARLYLYSIVYIPIISMHSCTNNHVLVIRVAIDNQLHTGKTTLLRKHITIY